MKDNITKQGSNCHSNNSGQISAKKLLIIIYNIMKRINYTLINYRIRTRYIYTSEYKQNHCVTEAADVHNDTFRRLQGRHHVEVSLTQSQRE